MANINKILKQIAEDIEKAIIITEDIIFPYKGFDPRKLYRDRYSYKRSLKTLEDKKLIKKTQNQFSLTLRGKLQILKKQNLNLKIENKKWDGKWRILAFDIPEKNRKDRKRLREYLSILGFKLIQQSIWITPLGIEYRDLADIFDKKTGEKLLYVVTKEISEEKKLKELFDLK